MHADLVATYRLQLSREFTFTDAAAQVGYLKALGISHLYLSPILQAADGSSHGYDAVAPPGVSEILGGEEGLAALFEQLRIHGMGAILDIVPNHLSASQSNPWWWELLKEGQHSCRAASFDVCWNPPDSEYKGKVVVPVLGDHLGNVVRRQEIVLDQAGPVPVLRYQHYMFPLNQSALDLIKTGRADVAELLDCQHYALTHWKSASEELNFRRFFDINTLVAVRAENEDVFEATHRTWFNLISSGPVDGVRVDHPDGLKDPPGYLIKLRTRLPEGFWLLVEKILEPGESLRSTWPVDGTTGYDFTQRCDGLFVDPEGERGLSDLYADFTGMQQGYSALVRKKKREVLRRSFACDLRRLVEKLRRVCKHPDVRLDFPREDLRRVLSEVVVGLPIYRTYFNLDRGESESSDLDALAIALAAASRGGSGEDIELLNLIESVLTGDLDLCELGNDFCASFQQLTGPVMAKGVEDAAFYCYNRLIALNEVGGDPARFGVSIAAFHEASARVGENWPKGMLASSTHDSKRSEDVRARIFVLSEIPLLWEAEVRQWSAHNQSAWDGREPDRDAEYYFYQTLVGAWPIDVGRLKSSMEKACREAGCHTSWRNPDDLYELRIADFVSAVISDPVFHEMLDAFIARIRVAGRINSLSQTVLKLTTPGIPDFYQGCELWNFSLVDPDNRRPVDYRLRKELLATVREAGNWRGNLEEDELGTSKLHVIQKVLELRRKIPLIFSGGKEGRYQPLLATGERSAHVVAYQRGSRVAVIVPRLVGGMEMGWGDTKIDLEAGLWRNIFDDAISQASVRLDSLLAEFPVAILVRTDPSGLDN